MLPRHHGILQNFQGTLWFSLAHALGVSLS